MENETNNSEIEGYQKWWDALSDRQKSLLRNQPISEVFDEYRALKQLSVKVNRGWSQLLFLWDLLDCDYSRLYALELQIKNCFVRYCPGDLVGIEEIMAMIPQRNLTTLDAQPYVDTTSQFYKKQDIQIEQK